MPKWTDEQKQVIDYRGGNLLVAAAAGSGKTAVLVERIISMLTDEAHPVSLEELVVMTFTEAAAAEMRERIRTALEEKLLEQPNNARLIRETGSIQNANICTIHAFCKRLITENYAAIDLDPGFRIGDQGEVKLLQADIIEDLMEARYEEADERYLRFVDRFAHGKADAGIDELILKLYEFSQANPWPQEWLADQRAEFAADTPDKEPAWARWYFEQLKRRLSDSFSVLKEAQEICEDVDGPESYLPTIFAEQKQLLEALSAKNLTELVEKISAFSFGRMRPSKSPYREAAAGMRNGVKKSMQKLAADLCAPNEADKAILENGVRESMLMLLDLVEEFAARFAEEKEKRHMLDFNDLEHYALRVLYTGEGAERRPSRVADDYALRLCEIMVDEYQDSNAVQEALIWALSAERFGRADVFLVGDVKQSIYGFRLARPKLFLDKYDDADYPKIELAKNFRSREAIIESVNSVFFRIMQKSVGGIDYTEQAALHLGRVDADEPAEKADSEAARDMHTELLLSVDDLADEALNAKELEAKMIAQRIRALVAEGYHYRDIVILMRSPGAWADTLVEVLGADGIPAYATASEGYFSAVEVETVLALLSVIDNPRQDIALAAVMHSPLFGFTDEELALIAAGCGSLQRSLADGQEQENALKARGEAFAHGAVSEFALGQEPVGKAARDFEGAEREALFAQEDVSVLHRNMDRDTDVLSNAAELAAEKEAAFAAFSEKLSVLTPELREKVLAFWAAIDSYRELSHYLSIHELLHEIYERTGYYNYVTAMPAGEKRRANLDALVDSALAFEETSYRGLFHFIRYIEKLRKHEEDQGEASIYTDQDELVRIMSIHKSKGLQFPVVILAGMARRFNRMDLREKILIDPMLGVSCDHIDLKRHVRIPSMKRAAVKEKLAADLMGEELRVLYVAMTRAQDKLIMTAHVSSGKKLDMILDTCGEEQPVFGEKILGAGNMLDWILMAQSGHFVEADAKNLLAEAPSKMVLRLISAQAMMKEQEEALKDTATLSEELAALLDVPDEEKDERLRRDFAFRYAHEAATRMYPKHSVSEIKEAQRMEYENDPYVVASGAELSAQGNVSYAVSDTAANEMNVQSWDALAGAGQDDRQEMFAQERAEADLPPELTADILDKAQRMEHEDNLHVSTAGADAPFYKGGGAARGNAYHRAFACYDYSRGFEQLSEQLSARERKMLDRGRFMAFVDSGLGRRFAKAQAEGRLYREQHFMKQVPYNYLFPDSDVDEPVLLQGVIDAYVLEDDGIVLVDYKTDRADEAVLRSRYKQQLTLYADALAEILGLPVKERLIYSVHLSRAFAV